VGYESKKTGRPAAAVKKAVKKVGNSASESRSVSGAESKASMLTAPAPARSLTGGH
jgi:hypothetical protein